MQNDRTRGVLRREFLAASGAAIAGIGAMGRGDRHSQGSEGRHPAKAGDVFFFRLNCTVGFYNGSEPNSRTRVLAVRSLFPYGRP